jgi:hypothetical protein
MTPASSPRFRKHGVYRARKARTDLFSGIPLRFRLVVLGCPRTGGVNSTQAKTCRTRAGPVYTTRPILDRQSDDLSSIAKTGAVATLFAACIYPISLRTIAGLLQTQRPGGTR